MIINQTKPKVLLNGSTMFDGGGMQVLINFIADSLKSHSDINWYYFISNKVKSDLDDLGIQLPDNKTLVLEKSTSNLFYWIPQFQKFKRWEKMKNFDMVYSISAPSYFFFKAEEIQRIANAYLANPNDLAFEVLPRNIRMKWKIKFMIQKYFLSKSDYFITQTNLVKIRLKDQFYAKGKKVEIVQNAVSATFLKNNTNFVEKKNFIFCIATANWHKNIHNLASVAWHLKNLEPNSDFKFITTVHEESEILKILTKRAKQLDVESNFIHLGRISQAKCKEYYLISKVTFLPTYLEVFSASLIESIHFQTPVLTTDFDFNRELILDNKFLFQPGDWLQAAKMLSQFLNDPQYGKQMINSVSDILRPFSSVEAFRKTEKIILKLIHQKNNVQK